MDNKVQIIEYPHCKECSEYYICKERGLNKYYEALNEIEKHFEYRCKQCREEYELYASCDVCWKKQILDIISKAKDGE